MKLQEAFDTVVARCDQLTTMVNTHTAALDAVASKMQHAEDRFRDALDRIHALELLPPATSAPLSGISIIAALREENRDLVQRLGALQKELHAGLPDLRWYVLRKVDLADAPSYSDTPWSDYLASDIKFLQDALDESYRGSEDKWRNV